MAPPKKAQAQKMSLGTFLTDESLGSWADEVESMPVAPAASESRTGYGERRAFSSTDRFGSGYNDRPTFSREQLPLPDKPPYTAHIGNLAFDVTESDVTAHFSTCSVTHVRIVEDRVEKKPKGFGYVEFATLEGLKQALSLNGSQFAGRNVRVSVAEPPKDRQETRDFSDWSRKGPLPNLSNDQHRRPSDRGYGSRNFDSLSDAGSDRGERRRPTFEHGDGKVRDFSNWERKGPLSPLTPVGPAGGDSSRPRTREGPRDRRPSPAWGEARSQEGSRPPRREFRDRPPPERAPTAPELDNQWRARMRPDPPAKSAAPSREASNPPSPVPPPAPAVRPKLNLQKRTVSEAETASPASAVSDSKSSPFGGARPIDTSAREREVEERRQLALRQKKEQEEKLREEKRIAKEAAAKADRPNTASSPASAAEEGKSKESGKAKEVNKTKENGEGSPTVRSGTTFEALSQVDGDGGAEAARLTTEKEHDDDEGTKGEVVQDKDVKPQEIVREPAADKKPNAWRTNTTEAKPTTADGLEQEGWSTVSKGKNNRRAPNQAARAIAS